MRVTRFLLSLFALLLSTSVLSAASQVEFTSRVLRIESDTALGSILVLSITPSIELPVRVPSTTEIKDSNGNQISLTDLEPGQIVKVEGIFTDRGILAREVELTTRAREFELSGEVESVQLGERILGLLGLEVRVPLFAEIEDQTGQQLDLGQVSIGDPVKVEGNAEGNELVARQVKLLTTLQEFAEIRLEGLVTELGPGQISIEVTGLGNVPILIDPVTLVQGEIVLGALVVVQGRLNEGLQVVALKIKIVRPFETVPDELRMSLGQTRRVEIILRSVLDTDLNLTLLSRDPRVAQPANSVVTIAAGSLSGGFDVRSSSLEGRTQVDVSASAPFDGVTQSVEIEVESDGPDETPDQGDDNPGNIPELTEVKWNPDKLSGVEGQAVEVTLSLTRPVSSDLLIDLFLKEGTSVVIAQFPSQVTIPAGQQSIPVLVGIGSGPGRARLRASLPLSVGGDTDDLEVELNPGEIENEEVGLSWQPDKVETAPGNEFTARLTLDQAAPVDFSISIVVKDGDPTIVNGMPSEVRFLRGSREQTITVQATNVEGKVKFRASAPQSLGGDQDDLQIEVEIDD